VPKRRLGRHRIDTPQRADEPKDVDAFLASVAEHEKKVRNLLYGIVHNASAVDDLLQETYLRAFRSLDSFRQDSSMKTWIYRIATNVALDHVRKVKDVIPFDATHEPTNQDADLGTRMDIFAALGKLSPEHRAAVLLVDLERFDYATAAEMCDVPPGTLASRVNAARKQLRQLLLVSDGSEEA
jgi:RNA polymerase sigma-70 factor (ECF subfamily)